MALKLAGSCPRCEGSGRIWDEHTDTRMCPSCYGTGLEGQGRPSLKAEAISHKYAPYQMDRAIEGKTLAHAIDDAIKAERERWRPLMVRIYEYREWLPWKLVARAKKLIDETEINDKEKSHVQ